jgi:hypothetical protein
MEEIVKKQYFEKEEELLKLFYEKYGKIFSKIRLNTPLKITPEILLEKNFRLEYAKINEVNNSLIYYDAVFENKSQLYLYLSRTSGSELNYQITVYFDSEKLNEVRFFINNLNKLKEKNGN